MGEGSGSDKGGSCDFERLSRGLAELAAVDAGEDRLGHRALQGARQAGPGACAVRAELQAEALCCEAEEGAEDVLTLFVDRT